MRGPAATLGFRVLVPSCLWSGLIWGLASGELPRVGCSSSYTVSSGSQTWGFVTGSWKERKIALKSVFHVCPGQKTIPKKLLTNANSSLYFETAQ